MTREIGTELLLTLATAVITGCIEIIVAMVRRNAEDKLPIVVVHCLPKEEPEVNEAEYNQPEGSASGAVSAIALIVLAVTLLSQCS